MRKKKNKQLPALAMYGDSVNSSFYSIPPPRDKQYFWRRREELMRHLARFLHIFQQGKEILDKTLLRICSISVSEVSHTCQLTSLNASFSVLITRGWARFVGPQEELVMLTPLPPSIYFTSDSHAHTLHLSRLSSPQSDPIQPWDWKLLSPADSGDGILTIQGTVIPLKGWIEVKCSISAFPKL